MYSTYYEDISHNCGDHCGCHHNSKKIKIGTFETREEAKKEAHKYCKKYSKDYMNISIIKKK